MKPTQLDTLDQPQVTERLRALRGALQARGVTPPAATGDDLLDLERLESLAEQKAISTPAGPSEPPAQPKAESEGSENSNFTERCRAARPAPESLPAKREDESLTGYCLRVSDANPRRTEKPALEGASEDCRRALATK